MFSWEIAAYLSLNYNKFMTKGNKCSFIVSKTILCLAAPMPSNLIKQET